MDEMTPENARRCPLCETMRPESRMTRQGAEWTCRDLRTCLRGQEIRAQVRPFEDHDPLPDHWRRNWWNTVRSSREQLPEATIG